MFTRTKHGAKKLAKQLNASGVPAVELHGNLSQGARTRNMDAFHGGAATTLVATDIAARGIHVDDVGLVIHADPPVEHKAYLHRSGRTARAGASGTVITLMTADQVADVRDLTRKAGIKPTTTRLDATHPLLRELAPGERAFSGGLALAEAPDAGQQRRGGAARGGQTGRSSGGSGRGQSRSGATSGGAAEGRASSSRGGSAGRGRNGGTAVGGRNGGATGGATGSGGTAAGRKPGGSGRRTGSPKGGSAAVYSTSSSGSGSGGAAAFSSRSRAGSRGGR